MNYRIIGNDGKTYGPVSAEKIREWIAQGRVENRTPVYVDGAADWTFAGLLPEFAAGFNPASLTPAPPTIAASNQGGLKKNNAFAIWSLVCGCLAWLMCCCCCVPFNLLGVVFGIIALYQISKNPETQEGRSLAIAGLILSGLSLLWCFGITLIQLATNQVNIVSSTNFN